MIKLKIAVVAVRERLSYVEKLREKLSLDYDSIFYDDEKKGPLNSIINILNTFKDYSHVIILQDDAFPCNNFLNKCKDIIDAHPNKVVALYPYDFMDEEINPINSESPYYNLKILSSVGLIFPNIYIKDFLDYVNKYGDSWRDDKTIREFCLSKSIHMIQTIPALVQHIGDNSIIAPDNPIRRTNYFYEDGNINWKSTKINSLDYYSSLDKRVAEKIRRSIEYLSK